MNKNKLSDYMLSIMLVLVTVYCGILIFNLIENEIVSVSGMKENKFMPIVEVSKEEKEVAITINTVWGSKNIYKILDALDEEGVKATFFFTGYWVSDKADEAHEIYERGHEIGSLGNNHIHNNNISTEKSIFEIVEGVNKIENVLGFRTKLFRPPFGEYNNEMILIAEELNLQPILWNIDSNDWMEVSAEHEVKSVLESKQLNNGSIILFHNDTKYTSESLVKIIRGLKGDGYNIVPVGELIHKENFYIDDDGVQKKNR